MTTAYVAFGANLGQPTETYDSVIRTLSESAGIGAVKASRLSRTIRVGGGASEEHGVFFNGALALETSLTPLELFKLLRAIEDQFGRVRQSHWGDRTIDLDLVLFGAQTVIEPSLIVPHTRMHFRRFVLAPLAELNPDAMHPTLGLSVSQLVRRMDVGSLKVILTDATAELRAEARVAARRIVGLADDAMIDAGVESQPVEWIMLGPTIVGTRWWTTDLQSMGVADGIGWTMTFAARSSTSRPESCRMTADTVVLPAVDCAATALLKSEDHVRFFFESMQNGEQNG